MISYEMVHDTRVIPLDGRPHIGSKIRQYLGDSRGHWEGNTLVVETTNLTDQTSIGANGNGLRHSADMKIVERFTRTEADVLKYKVTVDDPKTYTRPFTISIPLISPPGFQLLPYECHEGNYMLAAVLGGERAEDKALEEDAKKGIIRPRKGVQQGLDAGARPLPGTQAAKAGPRDDDDRVSRRSVFSRRPMVLTKAELITSLQNEVRILLHLASKIDRCDARLPSVAEAAQHDRVAEVPERDGARPRAGRQGRSVRPGGMDEAEKAAEARDFNQTLAAIAAHSDAYATLLGDMSDADFRAEVDHVRQEDLARVFHRQSRALRMRGVPHPAVPVPQGLRPRGAEHGEPVGRRRRSCAGLTRCHHRCRSHTPRSNDHATDRPAMPGRRGSVAEGRAGPVRRSVRSAPTSSARLLDLPTAC